MVIAISRRLLDRILAEAAAAPEHEVCGLLFGNAETIVEARPAANVAANPAVSFEVDPYALLAAHREQRKGGPQLIGHYHSHPDGSNRPSARDAAAAVPGWLWLIVGSGEAALWRSRLDGTVESMFDPEPMHLLGEADRRV